MPTCCVFLATWNLSDNPFFCCCSYLSNDDIISKRSGLKTGGKNDIFSSEIGSGFGEPGSRPPPRIPRSTPPPPGVLLPFPLLPSSLLSLTNNLNIPQNTEREWLMTRGLMTYIGSESGQELWLVNVIIVLFQLFLRMTDKRQNERKKKTYNALNLAKCPQWQGAINLRLNSCYISAVANFFISCNFYFYFPRLSTSLAHITIPKKTKEKKYLR